MVRALSWPPFARSALAQPASVVGGAAGEAAAVALVRFFCEDTVAAGTTGEGAVLASACLVGVDSTSHRGGGHVLLRRFSGLCSLGQRGLSQPLWWRARIVRALAWHLFARFSWAQPGNVMAGTIVDGADLASVRFVSVSSDNHCGGGHVWGARFSGFCLLGRLGIS